MKNKFLKYAEFALFYSCLALNVWIVFHFTFLGAMDGPAHLYYSRIIDYLISGNSFIKDYFVLNTIPAPNYTDHYLLAFFNIFFKTVVSYKILILLYFLGFPLCFRLLIKKYNPRGIALSALSIPFTHCLLFYLSFYNFAISFTFLLLAIIYYLRNFLPAASSYSTKKYLIFFLVLLLNYFTNGIGFFYITIACGLFELYKLVILVQIKGFILKAWLKHILLLTIIWIPCVIMLYIFNKEIAIPHNDNIGKVPFATLAENLFNLRSLCVYTSDENHYSRWIFVVIMILFGISIVFRFNDKESRRFLYSDVFFLLFLGTLICYFIIPDGASVGMLSERLGYYVFVFLIIWIALQNTSGVISLILTTATLAIFVVFFFKMHYNTITTINNNALSVQNSANYIQPNSVVLPIDFDDSWLEPYMCDYLGTDKPLAIIRWYEPDLNWFAVQRNFNGMPKLLIPGFISAGNINWALFSPAKQEKEIDYIYVYGTYSENINKPENAELNSYLQTKYTPVFVSNDLRIHIFKRK